MINFKIKLLKIIDYSCSTKKSDHLLYNKNIIAFKVSKYANKIDIKNAIFHIFKLHVIKVNTLIYKNKVKNRLNSKIRNKNWKKAYVILKPNQNLIYLNKINDINN